MKRHSNPSVGAMDWESAIAMMRADLSKVKWSDKELEDFAERRDRQLEKILIGFSKASEGERFMFPLIKAARMKKIWVDFGRIGIIRDEKGLDNIAEQMLNNIALLDATNALLGHSQEDPVEMVERAGMDLDEQGVERLLYYLRDPDTGVWYVSDYGLPYLHGAYALILRSSTPEERLYAVDKALNVVHQRSDLASWFVEGGTKTLNEIANAQ